MSEELNLSGDLELDKQISTWLRWDRNETTLSEIKQFVSEKKWDILKVRLINRLSFGTAGLRGVMRAGFDSLNDLVIIQSAQGLCEYILQQYPKIEDLDRGIVFGYDGRYCSKRFAELSSCVFLNKGFKVLLFSKTVVTPFIPFTISKKNCLAGVMVTASHNPKEDNGYKVYWTNSAQIITPHDKGIQKSILENLEPLNSSWDTSCLESSNLVDPFEEMFSAYFSDLLKYCPDEVLQTNCKSDMRFVYTAMHGVGYPFIEKAFQVAKLKPVVKVAEQCDPDPEFPTVKFPNPEEGQSSLELAIKKAEDEVITAILANDPDADRLAYAEKDLESGKWKIFNGNELGALLGWWAVYLYQKQNPDCKLSDCYMLASTVSSKILQSMSVVEGFNFDETLTGFKWMGNRSCELINQNKHVLFAFEEAIGFMFSTIVLDKDGISAAFYLASMICYLKSVEGITANEKLQQIYHRYGYHCTKNSYLFCYDEQIIKKIFERLRHFESGTTFTYPKSIHEGKFPIKHVRDLTIGIDTSQADGKARLPVSSKNQMITFTFENGLVVTLRTSGTEPKIKYYAELCCKPEEKNWKLQQKILHQMVDEIVKEFLQPYLNNLIAKSD